jgi:hypothetical protein
MLDQRQGSKNRKESNTYRAVYRSPNLKLSFDLIFIVISGNS